MIKKISTVLVLLTVLALGLDAGYKFFLKQNQNIKLSHVDRLSSPEILFHGPCEPLFTIDPFVIDSICSTRSYNLALRHTDFADNYLHLYLYLKKQKPPKQVYLYVTPESFDTRFNAFHTYNFIPYLEDSIVSNTIAELDPDYANWSQIPLIRFTYFGRNLTFNAIQGAYHYFEMKKDAYFESGYQSHDSTLFHLQPDGYIAPKHLLFSADKSVTEITDSTIYYELYEDRQHFTWDATREKYLHKIFELCENEHIELILYESTPYSASVKDQPNRIIFLQRINSIAQQHESKFIQMDHLNVGKDKSNYVCPLIFSVKGTQKFLPIFADTVLQNLRK